MTYTHGVDASDIVRRNVRRLLEAQGWSWAQLGEALGWSRSQVSKVFNPDNQRNQDPATKRPIRLEELMSVALALSSAPLMLLTPNDEDEETNLFVETADAAMVLQPVHAFRWLAGILPPRRAPIAWDVYYFSVPPVAREHTEAMRRELEDAETIEVDFRSGEVRWLEDDGTWTAMRWRPRGEH